MVHPVYKSTYERQDSLRSDYADESNFYKEHVIAWAKDMRRTIDYLATRPDVDTTRLAYYGASWGGYLGGLMPAVEPRFKAAVLLVAGLEYQRGQPEVEPINFLPRITIPVLSQIPLLGPILFRDQSIMTYIGFVLVPVAWYWIDRTRPGLNLRAVGERPAAADAQGIDVIRVRYAYVLVGGLLAGLAGATITLAISPGWFGDQTVAGRGWIAVGLVIFAQWSPIRAAIGAYLFGAIFRFIIDLQGVKTIFGFDNPFQAGRSATFFLEMLPYLFVVVVVIIGSREALRRRVGAPAALGIPYVRGERGA